MVANKYCLNQFSWFPEKLLGRLLFSIGNNLLCELNMSSQALPDTSWIFASFKHFAHYFKKSISSFQQFKKTGLSELEAAHPSPPPRK